MAALSDRGCRLEVSSLHRVRNPKGEIIKHSGEIYFHFDGRLTPFSVRLLAARAFAPKVRWLSDRRRPRGQNHAKLTEAQVLEIRRQAAADHSGAEIRRLADVYGVSRDAIEDVVFCRSWKHLPGAPPPRLPRGRPFRTRL
jgi:hypothetical protein